MRALLLIFSFLCLQTTAFAASLGEVRTTLYTGQIDTAHEQALALGGVDGLVLASEALNVKLLLGDAKKPAKIAKTSMKLAQQALSLSPDNSRAQMQYAIAYGFYGRHMSAFKAWRKKIPLKIKAEIDKAVLLNGDSPESDAQNQALLGAWHLSVIARAGHQRGQKFYGANEQSGYQHFEAAQNLHPENILITANYALMRYVLDPETQHDWTLAQLEHLVRLTPSNEIEAQVQVQMNHIFEALSLSGDAMNLVKNFLS